MYTESVAVSYKMRLNSGAELIILNLINKLYVAESYRNTNIRISVLSKTDKQHIDSCGSLVVKPRDIGG